MRYSIIVPETWDSLNSFAQWFKENDFPMRVPANMQIYITDNSYSCVVFRQNVYQAELYMIAPNKVWHKHSHDFEHLWIIIWGRVLWQTQHNPIGNVTNPIPIGLWKNESHPDSGKIWENLLRWEWHNIDTFNQGCLMYVLQRWDSEEDMTSAIIWYIWEPMWPIHKEVLLMNQHGDIKKS